MVSRKRPSRGARRSATTTRQTGSFLPPTRVRRMETLIAAASLAAAHELAHVGHLALLQPLHHLAHLAELLDELVDLLDARPGAPGDPLATAALDDVRPPALLRGHREDDRLHAVELALVDVELRELVSREAGDHPQQRGQRSHLADLAELGEEVVERELALAQLALEILGLLLLRLGLGLLDERE